MIKYKTLHNSIERIEVLRETVKCVFIKGNSWGRGDKIMKCLKRGPYCNYFDTFPEAKSYLLDDKIKNIIIVKNRLTQLEHDLKTIKLL